MNKIKIISDGTPQGTHVHAGGVEIQHIVGLKWEIAVNGIAKAVIEFSDVEIDAVVNLEDVT